MTNNSLSLYKKHLYSSDGYTLLAHAASVIMIATIILYLAAINFSLSFMTMDELDGLLNSYSDVYAGVTESGRASHFIAWIIVEPLTFYNPTTVELVPRFLSIIFLYLTLIIYLQSIFKSWLYCITFASIAIGGHLVDWQHNGMVAFFGSYNIFLAAFLLSLTIAKSHQITGGRRQIIVCLLLFASFPSEFFVGFSALCAIYFLIFEDKGNKTARPFIASILLYLLLYLVFNFVLDVNTENALVRKEAMNNYIYGTVNSSFSIPNFLKGSWVYLSNSIPSSSFKINLGSFYPYIIGSILVGYLLIYSRVKANIEKNSSIYELLLVASVLFVVPNMLISLQPTKLQWALTGSSNRYVFSYYSWIGFVFIMSLAAYCVSRKNAYALVLVAIITGPLVVNSMTSSITFTKPYKESTKKWLNLNVLLRDELAEDITVNEEYLIHPGITPIDEKYLSDFARKYYNKELTVLSDPSVGYNFGPRVLSFIEKIEGLSGYEEGGRWTEGKQTQFFFKQKLPDNFQLKIELSAAYGPNNGKDIVVNVGDWTGSFVAHPKRLIVLTVNKTTETKEIAFLIPRPISPNELEQAADNRELGIRFTHLSFDAIK